MSAEIEHRQIVYRLHPGSRARARELAAEEGVNLNRLVSARLAS